MVYPNLELQLLLQLLLLICYRGSLQTFAELKGQIIVVCVV